ncbi:MAG TPA: hypothetical protein VF638_16705 [Sphingomonas sp.]|jgi:hypothetical protein
MLLLAMLVAACGPAQTPVPVPTTSVVRIALPDDPDVALPPLLAQQCTACHSAEMIANQPPLGADKWAATVKKMREVYHAPIDAAEDAALVAALVAMQATPAERPAPVP